jgi:hypothetical protein
MHPSLRNGDVITSLNGVGEPTFAMLYGSMCRREVLSLTVCREEEGVVEKSASVTKTGSGGEKTKSKERCTPRSSGTSAKESKKKADSVLATKSTTTNSKFTKGTSDNTKSSKSAPRPPTKLSYPTLSTNETKYTSTPAPSLPRGWTQRTISHNSSGELKRRAEIMFYSPALQIKFRSKKRALEFADMCVETGGDEEMAWELLMEGADYSGVVDRVLGRGLNGESESVKLNGGQVSSQPSAWDASKVASRDVEVSKSAAAKSSTKKADTAGTQPRSASGDSKVASRDSGVSKIAAAKSSTKKTDTAGTMTSQPSASGDSNLSNVSCKKSSSKQTTTSVAAPSAPPKSASFSAACRKGPQLESSDRIESKDTSKNEHFEVQKHSQTEFYDTSIAISTDTEMIDVQQDSQRDSQSHVEENIFTQSRIQDVIDFTTHGNDDAVDATAHNGNDDALSVSSSSSSSSSSSFGSSDSSSSSSSDSFSSSSSSDSSVEDLSKASKRLDMGSTATNIVTTTNVSKQQIESRKRSLPSATASMPTTNNKSSVVPQTQKWNEMNRLWPDPSDAVKALTRWIPPTAIQKSISGKDQAIHFFGPIRTQTPMADDGSGTNPMLQPLERCRQDGPKSFENVDDLLRSFAYPVMNEVCFRPRVHTGSFSIRLLVICHNNSFHCHRGYVL